MQENLTQPDTSESPKLTRRQFLVRTAIALGVGLAAKAGIERLIQPGSKKLVVGDRSIAAQFDQAVTPELIGPNWFPDGHSSFIKTDGRYRVFFSGGPYAYMAEGSSLTQLGQPKEILSPSGLETFDRNYAAPGSVVRGANPDELLMLYHGEYHPNRPNSFPFKARIGLATSVDHGETWERRGQILKGMHDFSAEERPYGAGQPSAIIKDDYIFLYYVDWNEEYGDSIHLARSPLSANGAPDSWEKCRDGGFSNSGMNGLSSPVIAGTEGDYAALPGVSWNIFLKKYLMIFETRGGFDIATSADGIIWENRQRLLDVQTANNNPEPGKKWNSYPSLWSPNQDSDGVTDDNLLLVYSEGKWQSATETHRMKFLPIRLA